ncbi:MAG: YajQ family cyclic di-GMP-binding protein [Bdellovibrionia bacterium]
MPSFDIVSEIDLQEADNAINQAKKEIEGRYDFKGSLAEIKWDKKEVIIQAEDDYKIETMVSIVQTKMHRRGIDIKALKVGEMEPAGGKTLRLKIELIQGIDREKAKDIMKVIRDSKLKVQSSVVDDKVRVQSKSIDELQATMALLRGQKFDIALQFNNMRS